MPKYTVLMAPSLKLLKKDESVKNDCGPGQQGALERVKQAFVSTPSIQHPDFGKAFVLYSDASELAIGSVLCQQEDEDQTYAINAYFSRKLNDAKTKYAIPEKETIALIVSHELFRVFIFGFELHCYVDQVSTLSIYDPTIRAKTAGIVREQRCTMPKSTVVM